MKAEEKPDGPRVDRRKCRILRTDLSPLLPGGPAGNRCERNGSDEGCFQKACCETNGYPGCWACADLERCTEGIYRDGARSKVRAFALCIRQEGLEAFVGHVLRNRQAGLRVEKGGDYDGLPTDAVLRLLRSGRP